MDCRPCCAPLLRGGIGARLRRVITEPTIWREPAWTVTRILADLPLAVLAVTVVAGFSSVRAAISDYG